jgi:hypothetical protein
MDRDLRIQVSDTVAVTGRLTLPVGEMPGWIVTYAPGAGSGLADPFGAFLSGRLVEWEIGSLRFQFPYREEGRKLPDRPAVLEATWRAALSVAREHAVRVIAAGRSMGGRIASHVVAAESQVDALGLFAYPLHPPGRPGQTRDAHLGNISVPTLFCSGTRDAFASPEELRSAAALVPDSQVCLMEGADHSFAVPKASGRTRDEVWEEALRALRKLLDGVSLRTGG